MIQCGKDVSLILTASFITFSLKERLRITPSSWGSNKDFVSVCQGRGIQPCLQDLPIHLYAELSAVVKYKMFVLLNAGFVGFFVNISSCSLWRESNRLQWELKLAFCMHGVYIYTHTQTAQSQKQGKDGLEGSKYR